MKKKNFGIASEQMISTLVVKGLKNLNLTVILMHRSVTLDE